MNTPAELSQAMADVMAGKFGTLRQAFRPPERAHLRGLGSDDDEE
jgi:hypothetical protein